MDVIEFNAQKDMPESKSKLNAIAISERLDNMYQFIKQEYILKKKELNCTVQELYNQYVRFTDKRNKKALGKTCYRLARYRCYAAAISSSSA